jgi:catechol 2,3-dioxygenase-like lactoylglutathione lyase family enzyme
VTVTALVNLAVKVGDIEEAVSWYRGIGATVTDPVEWEGAQRADVVLGALSLTLFTRALYEDRADLPGEGFLHVALMSDDLEGDGAGMSPLWGPRVIRGAFGVRRVLFLEAPGGIRLELMEQLDEPG